MAHWALFIVKRAMTLPVQKLGLECPAPASRRSGQERGPPSKLLAKAGLRPTASGLRRA